MLKLHVTPMNVLVPKTEPCRCSMHFRKSWQARRTFVQMIKDSLLDILILVNSDLIVVQFGLFLKSLWFKNTPMRLGQKINEYKTEYCTKEFVSLSPFCLFFPKFFISKPWRVYSTKDYRCFFTYGMFHELCHNTIRTSVLYWV